jgi:hypothetical protein
MTTTRDIVAGAYRKLGLLPLGANLDPDRTAAGLAAYNGMLNAWAAEGIFPGAPPPPLQPFGDENVCGNFINGGGPSSAAGFPPYGPSDGSAPPSSAALSFGLDDPFPFPAAFVEGAKAMLAVELAPESGIEPQPSIQNRAEKARQAMLAYYVIAPRAGQDPTWMPSLHRLRLR